MINHIRHTYVTPHDPSARALMARILDWSTASPHNLNTVIAYEDIDVARRAREMCTRLSCRVGGPLRFDLHLWRFEVLRIPQLRDTAVKDAAQAHLIIVATHGMGGLSHETGSWIELWLAERLVRCGALVLLVETIGPLTDIRDSRQYRYLEKTARRAKMDFFAGTVMNPNAQGSVLAAHR